MKKNQKSFFICIIAGILFISSCKKNDSPVTGSGNTPSTKGNLYWGWIGGGRNVNLSTGKFSEILVESWDDGFDVSWDSKKILTFSDFGLGTFNFSDYRIIYRDLANGPLSYSNLSDGKNILDFTIEWEDMMNTSGKISPNEKFVALDAQNYSDLPIAVVSIDNKDFNSTFKVPGVSFNNYGKVVWSADNTLYFRIDKTLYKSSAADNYKTATPIIVSPEPVSWAIVNPQATKVVYRKNKHLWLANIDGGDAKQITNSETLDFIAYDGESKPTFSPDGKYIAFVGSTKRGTPWSDHDYPDGSWVASVGGKYGYIIIIPADGKLYNIDEQNSGAFWLKEGSNFVPCDAEIMWR